VKTVQGSITSSWAACDGENTGDKVRSAESLMTRWQEACMQCNNRTYRHAEPAFVLADIAKQVVVLVQRHCVGSYDEQQQALFDVR